MEDGNEMCAPYYDLARLCEPAAGNYPLMLLQIITKYLIFSYILLKYLVFPGFGP